MHKCVFCKSGMHTIHKSLDGIVTMCKNVNCLAVFQSKKEPDYRKRLQWGMYSPRITLPNHKCECGGKLHRINSKRKLYDPVVSTDRHLIEFLSKDYECHDCNNRYQNSESLICLRRPVSTTSEIVESRSSYTRKKCRSCKSKSILYRSHSGIKTVCTNMRCNSAFYLELRPSSKVLVNEIGYDHISLKYNGRKVRIRSSRITNTGVHQYISVLNSDIKFVVKYITKKSRLPNIYLEDGDLV